MNIQVGTLLKYCRQEEARNAIYMVLKIKRAPRVPPFAEASDDMIVLWDCAYNQNKEYRRWFIETYMDLLQQPT